MSDPHEPTPEKNRRGPSPHDVPPRIIALIFAVMIAGLAFGMFLVMPHYGPRKPRHRSALGHVVPTSMIGRETNGMVWIPGGLFLMGSNDGGPDETPVHEVNVGPVWMDKTEVTNEQFSKFVEATGYITLAERSRTNQATWRHPTGLGSSIVGKEMYPVVQVAWEDAAAFAKWAAKRLPTEAEWEHAARGGLNQQCYPWGNEGPTPREPRANIGLGETNRIADTMSVASFSTNGYGLFDMAGNVSEWCADWSQPDYYKTSPNQNPKGPAIPPDPPLKLVRGGSYLSEKDKKYRVAARSGISPETARPDLGFRCVKNGF